MTSFKRALFWGVSSFALLVAAAVPAQAAKPVPPVAKAAVFGTTVVGTSPYAAAQPSPRGRTIGDLALDNGRLYAAYGDYADNTGPIQVAAFDPGTRTFGPSELTVPTEQISVYRTIGGSLYAPMTDPTLSFTSKVGYATNSTGAWTNQFNAPMVHTYDVATLTGQDRWMAGASVYPPSTSSGGAAAWRSTDGGVTWSMVARDTSAVETGYERYYWMAAVGGQMWMQARDVTGGAPLRSFNGTSWSSTTKYGQLCPVIEAKLVEVFNGKMICAHGNQLRTFDGRKLTTVTTAGWAFDLAVPGDGFVYELATDGIRRSADGLTWTLLGTADLITGGRAASVTAVNGTLYLGTMDSTIVRVDGLDARAAVAATTAPCHGKKCRA